jgi:hypothetical protein
MTIIVVGHCRNPGASVAGRRRGRLPHSNPPLASVGPFRAVRSAMAMQQPRKPPTSLNPFLSFPQTRRYPQICQPPVEKSKVITQHSTPLTPLYSQRYLAGFFSQPDILNL